MRYSHLLIIFFVVMGCLMLTAFFNTNVSTKATEENDKYSSYLTTATKDAINSTLKNIQDGCLFSEQENRQLAVDTFYRTLVGCFNYDNTTSEELVKYYVPCIFLIDKNGYYIEYAETYTASNGLEYFKDVITPIHKWEREYSAANTTGDRYYIEYHLDNSIHVTKSDYLGNVSTYDGPFYEVYEELGSPDILKNHFSDLEKFESEKNDCIINDLTNKMTYYINIHDEFYNQKNDAQYQFTLPLVTDEDWARLIDQPTVFSFLQGLQPSYYDYYINIYALASGELTDNLNYIITENETDLYYHRENCSSLSSSTDNSETIDSIMNTNKTYSMEECAAKGAYPCPECIR